MIINNHSITFYSFNVKNSYYTSKNFPLEWQLMLLSDGSFTQNLNSIIGQNININLIRQNLINKNQIIRQVWIEGLHKNKMAFAESYWKKNDIKKSELSYCKPIGKSMINDELDISKKIHNINYGYNFFIEKTLQIKHPIFSREYIIWYNNKPLTTIKEFFSPNLDHIK
uniref:hypothetical protein n=1 Tax=Lithothamnion corallioides TaxID=1277934 RepID=UPI0023F1E13E|nr:hypothetical protein P6G75_pgp076 [Lithothamnion corallioides]WEA77115.1 hypothetical protein [Lithothamnion corallioides]